ncbi:SCF-associated factor 1 [Nakaseomyces bracarensis]|uniref:SCF-associated factor 1 n=1 Tax=Nakaseomyces bracarensis TaxID=273131 RepID=A0ABR4P0Y8_9SACH
MSALSYNRLEDSDGNTPRTGEGTILDDKLQQEKLEVLLPDIVQSTLPYLEPSDIKNLSYTNRYYHNLLDYEKSLTLWNDLFLKAFVPRYTTGEPFQSENTVDFKTCAQMIMMNAFPDLDWHERYRIREVDAAVYTWGCLKHARLGYTVSSNQFLETSHLNGSARLKIGVNTPTKVPWYEGGEGSDLWSIEDKAVSQIACGGFSFQILTKSGKLFNTGSNFSGGHRGPSPPSGEHDYNPFRELTRALERSYTVMNHNGPTPINITGTFPRRASYSGGYNSNYMIPSTGPHDDIYEQLQKLENVFNQSAPDNSHVRRLLTIDTFKMNNLIDEHGFPTNLEITSEMLDTNKFIAVTSGRSHILALDDRNRLYSWDNPETEAGVRIDFEFLHHEKERPILKIDSGWDFNCVYIYSVGLVAWKSRDALKKNDSSAKAHYEVVPNTGALNGDKKIVDFSCTQNNIVYFINKEGSNLYEYSRGVVREINLPVSGKLSKLIACFASLVVFDSQKNCYCINVKNGELQLDTFRMLELEDEEEHIISVASGDYHTLALTQKGTIYTWGTESQSCGCLGLGDSILDGNQGRHSWLSSMRNVNINKPMKISLPNDYTCVAVAAGGWQSGAIIIKK